MTATLPGDGRASGAERGSVRRGVFWVLLVGGVLLMVALSGRAPADGVPFSPRSTDPSGAAALRELLVAYDTDVEVTANVPGPDDPAAGGPTVLVLTDDLTDQQRADLMAWVRRGGRVVVADSSSPLVDRATPDVDFDAGLVAADRVDRGLCTIEVLTRSRAVSADSSARFEIRPGDGRCFGGTDRAVVVAVDEGTGTVVGVAAPALFTNGLLGDQDNAFVALGLLGAGPDSSVRWLQRDGRAPTTDDSLWGLVGPGPRGALAQLVVAGVLLVAARARRLGRPVPEAQPVAIESSALVAAVGDLLERRQDPSSAARLLRRHLRAELCRQLSQPVSTPPDALVDLVVDRHGVPRTMAESTILDHPIPDDDALVALTTRIDLVRQELLHDPSR